MIVDDAFLELYVIICQTISKPDRLKILHTIGKGKMNVSALQKELNIPMSNLSNHLSGLYRSGILGKEKKGNFVYYYLRDPELIKGIANMQRIVKGITSNRTAAL